MSRLGMDKPLRVLFPERREWVLNCHHCGHREHQPEHGVFPWKQDLTEAGCPECGRNLTSRAFRSEVVEECRICREPVSKWGSNRLKKYCSKRCQRIAASVQSLFTWSGVRRRVLERDGYECQNPECGRDVSEDTPHTGEVDHIHPIGEGGHPLDARNLITLCAECHSEKTHGEREGWTNGDAPGLGPRDMGTGLDAFLETEKG